MTHYVYAHISNKTNTVFYIGKGQRRRAFSSASRNKHWRSIAESHGFSVVIIRNFTNAHCAFAFEKILISTIGIEHLTNVCRGGEGGAGAKNGPENPMHGRFRENHPRWGAKHSDESREAIRLGRKNGRSNAMSEDARKAQSRRMMGNTFSKGIRKSPDAIAALSLKFSGEGNPSYNPTIHDFIHDDGSAYSGTMHNFCKEFSLSKGNVCWLIKGKKNAVKGWRMAPK